MTDRSILSALIEPRRLRNVGVVGCARSWAIVKAENPWLCRQIHEGRTAWP